MVLLVGRHGHDLVEVLQAVADLAPLHEQLRDLHERRQDAPAQDAAGDQPAHGELAVVHEHRAHGHGGDVGDLLDGRGHGVGRGADVSHLELAWGQLHLQLVPAVQELGLAAGRLDRLDTVHALHQKALLAIGLLGKHLVGVLQALTERVADHEHDHQEDDRDESQDPADVHDDEREEEREGRVGQHEERGRGHEGAHALKAPELGDEGAHVLGARV